MLLSCNAVPVANMQTFPPASNARGSGVGSTTTSNNNNRGYQTMGAPTGMVLIQYFLGSLWSCDLYTFLSSLCKVPVERYGLVWISTTLVFLLSYLGNFATYLMLRHTDRSASRSFDVGYVNTAAVAIYGYAITVPMGFYFLLQYLGLSTSLIRFWCMWGYSLFIFVPCSVVLVIPVEFMRWVIILAAGVDSACFVTANLKTVVEVVEGGDLTIVLVASFLLQLALAIFIKVWFFP
ncbi:Protein YIPF1 homolog [Linum grandiflorum]